MRSPISKKRWKYLDYRLYYLMRFWLKILRPSLSWQLLQVCVCVCMCFKYVFATRYKKKVSSFSLLIDLFLKRIDRIHCTLQCTLNRRKGPLKRKIKHGSMHMCDESVNFVLILKRVKFSLFSVDSRTKTYHCIFLCMPFIIWKTSG